MSPLVLTFSPLVPFISIDSVTDISIVGTDVLFASLVSTRGRALGVLGDSIRRQTRHWDCAQLRDITLTSIAHAMELGFRFSQDLPRAAFYVDA
ncbi:hypothetical protein P3342_007998 [Pyrenophora teres f. teres]|nr:hypothetical protein P3342_007998 [Pyrenophora teres f. teres]